MVWLWWIVAGLFSSGAAFELIAHLEEENGYNEVCGPRPSGKQWILARRRRDHGWGEDTHRAVIALAVDDYSFGDETEEGPFIVRQLQVELTKALLRNSTGPKMHLSDLSLYIHALLCVKMNPRQFHGEDLVAKLEFAVQKESTVSPLSVLALCNAGVVTREYLDKIRSFLADRSGTPKSRELQAIALKAYACAVDSDASLYVAEQEMRRYSQVVFESLWKGDGSFGNVYTTALVTQALVAAKFFWRREHTMEYLRSRLGQNINMLSTYSILLALNSERVPFIKLLGPELEPLLTEDGFPSIAELKSRPQTHYVQYTLRIGDMPRMYFTVTIKIPYKATFFDVMRLVGHANRNFEFSYSLNHGQPEIYSISGVPNDPEDNYYWRLFCEDSVDHDRHTSNITEIFNNPNSIYPTAGTHWIYWYVNMFKQIPRSESNPEYIVQ